MLHVSQVVRQPSSVAMFRNRSVYSKKIHFTWLQIVTHDPRSHLHPVQNQAISREPHSIILRFNKRTENQPFLLRLSLQSIPPPSTTACLPSIL